MCEKLHNSAGPVLVSACLLGLSTRYDGSHCVRHELMERLSGQKIIPVCPEQLGGLPTPREPAEINRMDGHAVLREEAVVLRRDGGDVTEEYVRGAEQVLRIARLTGARRAVLKEGSPACGVSHLKRDGRDVKGHGVTAALLQEKGVDVEGIE
jgi:uncharacterized protein YbbK (DUF523 family)